jgi:beta-glucosidase-like glycosyl hydrolase
LCQTFCRDGFAESGRDYNTVDVSETTLQNTIFLLLKAAVDAGENFYEFFNELNGIPATGIYKDLELIVCVLSTDDCSWLCKRQ